MTTSMYAVTDPSTGEVVKEYPTATDQQIEAAIASASKAHSDWSRESTVADRAALIRKVGELHAERKDELAKIINREMGKPIDQSEGEVEFSAAIYEYYADNAEKFLADEPIDASRGRGLGADPARLGRRAARHHAVELPVLPGGAVRRAEPDAGQHHRAQARSAVPGVGGGDAADLRRRRISRGRLRQHLRDQRADRRRSSPTRACRVFR